MQVSWSLLVVVGSVVTQETGLRVSRVGVILNVNTSV